jgi:glycosyltransferase involved in cell wall biosynthesis
MSEKIPCSVEILTHNSAATLPRALESVKDFAEVIIIDGASTDSTLEIARAKGARIIAQDPASLYPDGRIRDFAAVRNQGLEASTQPWFFFLDSDEYLSSELASAIREISMHETTGAYWVNRKYVLNDVVIECAASYPNRSMRLFAKESVRAFRKKVHERIVLNDGVVPEILPQAIYVPVDIDRERRRAKAAYYAILQGQKSGGVPMMRRIGRSLRGLALALRLLWRLAFIRIFCTGQKLPLEMDLEDVRYQFAALAQIWSGVW